MDFLDDLLNELDALEDAKTPSGKHRIKLRYCLPEEATYVSGSGVCGCLAPISAIEVVGLVPWSDQDLAEHRERAIQRGRAGKYAVTIERPIEQQAA